MSKKDVIVLLAGGLLMGCRSPQPSSLAAEPNTIVVRNNSYSLLHQLMDEQKDVSILRFIKPEHADIKNLTKQIAAASKAAAQELEAFAKRDPSIRLDDTALPPGEIKTRDAISKTKEKNLLTQTGRKFDLTLLLAQAEALSYASHLAKVTAAYETDPERVRALKDLEAQMDALYDRVFDMTLSLR